MSNRDLPKKVYIGDQVYADFDGFHIVLTTEDGYRITNRIYLEDSVYYALVRFAEKVWEKSCDNNQKT